jgi:hypothetical protein
MSMARALRMLFFIAQAGVAVGAASADERLRVAGEIGTGTAFSLPMTLTVRQSGFPVLEHHAHYATRPLDDAPYYAWRLGLWRHDRAWELQLTHHKLYLTNPPPEIEKFQVTHGYDMVTAGRAWRLPGVTVRAGAGVVIAHPESTVRGRNGPESGGFSPAFIGLLSGDAYFLTGPCARVSVGRTFGGRVFLAPDLELTAARARVPIADGEATVPNVALHLRLAVGARF